MAFLEVSLSLYAWDMYIGTLCLLLTCCGRTLLFQTMPTHNLPNACNERNVNITEPN